VTSEPEPDLIKGKKPERLYSQVEDFNDFELDEDTGNSSDIKLSSKLVGCEYWTPYQ